MITQPLPPPNRTCGSPASGSPVGGSPPRGLTGQDMGCLQREQPLFGKESVAYASFHPVFQGRQHPLRPDRRFNPRPAGARLSGLLSLRHCRRFCFRLSVLHESAFLRSLRSTDITPLHRYYGRSDSSPTLAVGRGLPAYRTRPSRHSAPNHLMRPARGIASVVRRAGNARHGLRHWLAGSPSHPAESGSSSCGLAVHLRLLSTPPRGDAVTFGYEAERLRPRSGLPPPGSNAFTGALAVGETHGKSENRF